MSSRKRVNRANTTFFLVAALFLSLSATPSIAVPLTPVLVKSIDPTENLELIPFGVAGSKFYFFATDPTEDQGGATHGTQLWSSDSTTAGIKMVKNINPTQRYCCPDGVDGNDFFIALGSKYLFTAIEGTHGNELWVSDGTARGTKMVKDINPKGNSGIGDSTVVVGKRLYFTADDGTHGSELWISNGTAKGTHMLKDINPKGDSTILDVTATSSAVFFDTTMDSQSGSTKLWSTDGTAAGTKQVKFTATAGTRILSEIVLRSTLYLGFHDGTHGNGLWRIAK